MGLLSVASGKNVSLVAQAQDRTRQSFQQWARDNGFEHCGVFCEKDGLMLLECAYGMDAQSVFSSISTKDFWLGSARSDSWITLDEQSPNFTAFTQFLGNSARAKTKAFRILKITSPNGLMVFFEYTFKSVGFSRISKDFSQELTLLMANRSRILQEKPTIYDTSELADGHKARLCLISTKRALDETTARIEVSELTIQKKLTETIFEEIFWTTKKLFASPGAIYSEDTCEIKAAAIINSDIEDEILKEQLVLEYGSLIGEEAAKKIIILTAGYSDDSEEILDYLLRG